MTASNHKDNLIKQFKSLATIAKSIGMDSLASEIKNSRLPKLDNEQFHLVVLGEFNHGKSTFVNALLGHDILPTGITPTTAALNHIVYGDTPSAKAIKFDGTTQDIPFEQLSDWVTVSGNSTEPFHHVEIKYPCELLKDNVTLVDTPGVNDLNEQRADITYDYLPRADAVIFLLDASQALKESEREFLSGYVLKTLQDRLVFVLGKSDLLSEKELSDVKKYTQEGLGKIISDPKLFAISSKEWLEGEKNKSGMTPFVADLEHSLKVDKNAIVFKNAAIDGKRTASYLIHNLGIKKQSIELDEKTLSFKIAEVKERLEESRRHVEELHHKIRAESTAIKNQAKLDLETFSRHFSEVIPEQIEKVDADHVKQFLGAFIGDTYREWAELQGANIAHLLEKLAEEVIKITNENLLNTAKGLSSRVDSKDTAIDIDIDSFKYNVGVYALGALGTTVMMFVNTLAGGLLALAAPILSIIVKSKVSGNIKEQAKEKAPVVIAEAAKAMAPHFNECIDGFADRLCEFVSIAGQSLYQGITEVLEHTLEEKRKSSFSSETQTQKIGDTINELRSLGDTFQRQATQRQAPKEPTTASVSHLN